MWGRVDVVVLKDLPHRGRGDAVPEAAQFALDAPVPPDGVLGGHPHDQLADLPRCSRPARTWGGGFGPAAGFAAAMPAQQGVGGDQPALTSPSRHPGRVVPAGDPPARPHPAALEEPDRRLAPRSVTNGPTEAINLIKRVKRVFGFTRFRNFRVRACSTPADPTGIYSSPSHPGEIRRVGNASRLPIRSRGGRSRRRSRGWCGRAAPARLRRCVVDAANRTVPLAAERAPPGHR